MEKHLITMNCFIFGSKHTMEIFGDGAFSDELNGSCFLKSRCVKNNKHSQFIVFNMNAAEQDVTVILGLRIWT